MKIFGKRIGNLISIIFGGKPVTVNPESAQEMEETMDLLKKANQGDGEATKKLEEIITKPVEETIAEISDVKEKQEKLEKTKEVFETTQKKFEVSNYSNLLNHPEFEIKQENGQTKYYLKGFKADLPEIIVQKFSKLIADGEDFQHLIRFWQLTLLNPNPEARRGLYKYITKQKMIITNEGYLLTFRRIVKVTGKKAEDAKIDPKIIEGFVQQVKKWKRGRRSYEIYMVSKVPTMFHIKNHAENNSKYEFVGTLHDVYERIKLGTNTNISNQDTYTDNHTKTMVIRIGEPVKQHRSKCNENSKQDCSYGLHLGTPSYVTSNSLGSVIVACLLNPQHVVSVPYSDAHKMRCCEYFPFMIITQDQLRKFDEIDISKYEFDYKLIEERKLREALNVSDSITPNEAKQYSGVKEVVTQEELDTAKEKFETAQKELEAEKAQIKVLLDDNISNELDAEEVKRIIKSRLS